MTDEEHEAYGAMVHAMKPHESPVTNDEIEALEKRLREFDPDYPDTWLHSQAADAIAHLRAEVKRLTRELACRDALIDNHLRKIMHLEADLKHVQGSDVGMMKLLHAEKLKTEAAERQVTTLREALSAVIADAGVTLRHPAENCRIIGYGVIESARAALAETEKSLAKEPQK